MIIRMRLLGYSSFDSGLLAIVRHIREKDG